MICGPIKSMDWDRYVRIEQWFTDLKWLQSPPHYRFFFLLNNLFSLCRRNDERWIHSSRFYCNIKSLFARCKLLSRVSQNRLIPIRIQERLYFDRRRITYKKRTKSTEPPTIFPYLFKIFLESVIATMAEHCGIT